MLHNLTERAVKEADLRLADDIIIAGGQVILRFQQQVRALLGFGYDTAKGELALTVQMLDDALNEKGRHTIGGRCPSLTSSAHITTTISSNSRTVSSEKVLKATLETGE